MTDTIDTKVAEQADAYTPTRPFEMRFVPLKSPYAIAMMGEAEIHMDGKYVCRDHIFEVGGGFYETDLVECAEMMLDDSEKMKIPVGSCHRSPIIFTKGKNNNQLDVQFQPPHCHDPSEIYRTSVTREDAAYEICKFLNDWYKYHIGERTSIPDDEMTYYSSDRFYVLGLFNRPRIRERFKQDEITVYDFKGIPERPDELMLEISESKMEKALLLLEAHWKEHNLRKAKQGEAITGATYAYLCDSKILPANTGGEESHVYYLPNNDRIEVHIKQTEQPTRKIMHVFVPTGDYLEILWDQLYDCVRKLGGTNSEHGCGKKHIFLKE